MMDKSMNNRFPEHLLRLGAAFAPSRVFHAAIELDLFTILDKPMTAAKIREALSLHERSMPDFFDCLVALNVLQRSGQGSEALYSNTPDTAKFLSRTSEAYAGGMLYSFATRSYKFWTHLKEGLETGQPQNEAHPRYGGGDGDFWQRISDNHDSTKNFLDSMVAFNRPAHQDFAKNFDFKNVGMLLDIGGGSGQLCCEVAAQNDHVRCICLELPETCKHGRENIRSQGLEDRVEMLEGSCLTADFPKCDVLVYSMVLHVFNNEQKKMLLRKAYDTLSDTGRVVVIEKFIDDERREVLDGLLMSLHMIIATENGCGCSIRELVGWTQDIGFGKTEVMNLGGNTSAVIVHR